MNFLPLTCYIYPTSKLYCFYLQHIYRILPILSAPLLLCHNYLFPEIYCTSLSNALPVSVFVMFHKSNIPSMVLGSRLILLYESHFMPHLCTKLLQLLPISHMIIAMLHNFEHNTDTVVSHSLISFRCSICPSLSELFLTAMFKIASVLSLFCICLPCTLKTT